MVVVLKRSKNETDNHRVMSQVGLKLSGFCVRFTVMFETFFGPENKEKKLIEKVK